MKLVSVLVLLAVLCLAPAVGAQTAPADTAQAPAPCSAPEARQFDFWVGDWDLVWNGGKGTNRVEAKWDGCVIEENFDGSGPEGNGLLGMSVSTYSPFLGQWRQTWVDNQGSYLDFTGGWEGDRMVLAREAVGRNGTTFHQRMVWYHIAADSFDWNWERSDDDGATWKELWVIHYSRRAG